MMTCTYCGYTGRTVVKGERKGEIVATCKGTIASQQRCMDRMRANARRAAEAEGEGIEALAAKLGYSY